MHNNFETEFTDPLQDPEMMLDVKTQLQEMTVPKNLEDERDYILKIIGMWENARLESVRNESHKNGGTAALQDIIRAHLEELQRRMPSQNN